MKPVHQNFNPRMLEPFPLIEACAVKQTATDHRNITTKSLGSWETPRLSPSKITHYNIMVCTYNSKFKGTLVFNTNQRDVHTHCLQRTLIIRTIYLKDTNFFGH